jgi:hypothetical protein
MAVGDDVVISTAGGKGRVVVDELDVKGALAKIAVLEVRWLVLLMLVFLLFF